MSLFYLLIILKLGYYDYGDLTGVLIAIDLGSTMSLFYLLMILKTYHTKEV